MTIDASWLFNSITAWLGAAGLAIIACIVLGYLFPKVRTFFAGAAAVIGAAAFLYAKGSRDRAAVDKARRDKAVEKVRKEYEKIDARPDDARTAAKRMRDGSY